jgi:hypothetical protein
LVRTAGGQARSFAGGRFGVGRRDVARSALARDAARVVSFAERQRLVGKPAWDALEKRCT